MAEQRSIDVAKLIDERSVTGFNIGLVFFSFFIIMSDGYDLTAIGFAAPHLIREWNITDRSVLGPVLSASLVGILIGSPVLGYVGDRFGRKTAAVASCLVFGVFTLAAAWAGSLTQMWWLRALAGVGLGGLLPNMIALNGEYAPRRYRATLIILMFCGVTLGGAFPGFLGNWLIPTYGWQVLFLIGGVFPIVLALCAALWLPESVKYLVLMGKVEQAARVLKRLEPAAEINPATKIEFPTETASSQLGLDRVRQWLDYVGIAAVAVALVMFYLLPPVPYGVEIQDGATAVAVVCLLASLIKGARRRDRRFSPGYLFSEGMALITPLLWICFAVNLMGYYFLISWMPTLLTGQRLLTPSDTATAAALIQVGGTIGGIALCRPMDTKGFWPVALLFVLAVPCVAVIGFAATTSVTALMVMVFLAGFCVLGLQFGLNAASAMIYPTWVRTNGSGWAFGVGRFGSILGPILGGYLIQRQLSVQQLFLAAAVPFVIGALACILLAILYRVRFKAGALGERKDAPLEPAGVPAAVQA